MNYVCLGSGSKGNCHYIEENNFGILIDAGISFKKIETRLKEHDIDKSRIKALFITHEHRDHISGAGIVSRKLDIPIYANNLTWKAMLDKIGKIDDKNIKIINDEKDVSFSKLKVSCVKVSHDAVDPVSYKITNGNKILTIATDLGYMTTEVLDFILKSNLCVLESNHDEEMLDAGPYPYSLKKRVKSNWGHLSNDIAGEIASKLVKKGTDRIMLAHLSETNNVPILAYQSVKAKLEENEIKIGYDVNVDVLSQNIVSNKIKI